MSAAQTQKENSEAGWGSLEGLGLSQKELVLAEALQMEYDALSRLKQDKNGSGTSQTESSERPRPIPVPTGGNLLRGLSGSDSSLHQPGGSQCPPFVPPRLLPPQGGHTKESLYILDSPQVSKFREPLGSEFPKGFPALPDDVPPALPPRNPTPRPSGSENPFLPRDVNLFSPDVDQPKVPSGDLNYDVINESLSRLNGGQPRGRRAVGEPGKPVARSKTLPPQVPPRTYLPVPNSNKNQRRVSADPVRTCRIKPDHSC